MVRSAHFNKTRFLLVFAHPDDETVACAGTIQKLAALGAKLDLVCVTDGQAGQVSGRLPTKLKTSLSRSPSDLAQFRKGELEKATDFLGINSVEYLDFVDGQITNKLVWGQLTEAIGQVILQKKPHFVITFDHTGWYYHLDHIGTSLAVTAAFRNNGKANGLFFVHFRPTGTRKKWPYIFEDSSAITHRVRVDKVDQKLEALDIYHSQDLSVPRQYVRNQRPHYEYYQLAVADEQAHVLLKELAVFEEV